MNSTTDNGERVIKKRKKRDVVVQTCPFGLSCITDRSCIQKLIYFSLQLHVLNSFRFSWWNGITTKKRLDSTKLNAAAVATMADSAASRHMQNT
jgi:hypothetical protein